MLLGDDAILDTFKSRRGTSRNWNVPSTSQMRSPSPASPCLLGLGAAAGRTGSPRRTLRWDIFDRSEVPWMLICDLMCLLVRKRLSDPIWLPQFVGLSAPPAATGCNLHLPLTGRTQAE